MSQQLLCTPSNIVSSTDNLLHTGKKGKVIGELSKLACLREVYSLLADPDSHFLRVFPEIFRFGKSEGTWLEKEASTLSYPHLATTSDSLPFLLFPASSSRRREDGIKDCV